MMSAAFCPAARRVLPSVRQWPRGFGVTNVTRSFASQLEASRLVVEKSTSPKEKIDKEKLTFGTTFTDHMLICDWQAEEGWLAPKIVPFGEMPVHPAASSLHYALQAFEGMKAYKDAQGKVRLFRPDMNMKRLNRSVERLSMPTFDGDQFTELIKELIRIDSAWVPEGDGYSLYIRPTAISTHPFLGVGAPKNSRLYVILSPVGPYYPTGFKPVSLYADNQNVRAWPGGVGFTKCGGNYAPTINPQSEAAQKGFQQVLWLYGENDEVTEVGTMNMFTLWVNEDGEKELVTAPLDGTILPGVTRDSILAICRDLGEFKVSERTYTMPQLAKAIDEGRVIDCFGAGTAAVVSPIKSINYKGKDYKLPEQETLGPLAKRMWDSITDIQYGRVENAWSIPL